MPLNGGNRVTQIVIETDNQPTDGKIRVTQAVVETDNQPTDSKIRVTQIVIETSVQYPPIVFHPPQVIVAGQTLHKKIKYMVPKSAMADYDPSIVPIVVPVIHDFTWDEAESRPVPYSYWLQDYADDGAIQPFTLIEVPVMDWDTTDMEQFMWATNPSVFVDDTYNFVALVPPSVVRRQPRVFISM